MRGASSKMKIYRLSSSCIILLFEQMASTDLISFGVLTTIGTASPSTTPNIADLVKSLNCNFRGTTQATLTIFLLADLRLTDTWLHCSFHPFHRIELSMRHRSKSVSSIAGYLNIAITSRALLTLNLYFS